MDRCFFLLIVGQLLFTCNRHARPNQHAKLVREDSAQSVTVSTLSMDSVQVDTTFVDVSSTIISGDCKKYGPILARSDGKIGYIGFNETVSMYHITYSLPGTIDELWTGYVCNLPDNYKRKGLKVGFVGSYYAAYRYIKPRYASDTPLYLVLEKIKAL